MALICWILEDFKGGCPNNWYTVGSIAAYFDGYTSAWCNSISKFTNLVYLDTGFAAVSSVYR
jgi:hypothetical protein